MTAPVHEPQPDTAAVAAPRAVTVGVIAGSGAQIDVVLDAQAPVSVMIDALVTLTNNRLADLGADTVEASGRGRWALCRVDGGALRPASSLTEQDVFDGDRLWLRFVPDTERRVEVVESISTAAAVDLGRRFAHVDPAMAVRVGASMLAGGATAAAALLGWWRWQHDTWVPTAGAAAVAAVVLAVALVLVKGAADHHRRRTADILLLSGLAPLSLSAAALPRGPVGSPNAVLGLGVLTVAAILALRFTGRLLVVYTAIVTVGVVATLAALARMVAMTGTVTVLAVILMVSVLGYQGAPALSRRLAGIRLPIFPSANSRWVFEARPELPTVVTVDGVAALAGPASVSGIVLTVERARSFLTGLLLGLGVLSVIALAGLTDAHSDRSWVVLLMAALTSGFLLLRGRSYVDRWQATILAVTAVLIVGAVAVRYAAVSQSVLSVSVAAAVLVAIPVAGLAAAAVVPNSIYSPLFRTVVEWIEYLCLLPIFPLALWLMDVYAAIRYR